MTSRVVIVYWKKRNDYEAFTSLKKFIDKYPHFVRETIDSYIMRKKIPFETEELFLTRLDLQ